jgi:polyisoprenoid-binding protein YceI
LSFSRDLALVVALHIAGALKHHYVLKDTVGYLAGQTTLRRLDFGIGEGQWPSTEWVANGVIVHYSLVMAPSSNR